MQHSSGSCTLAPCTWNPGLPTRGNPPRAAACWRGGISKLRAHASPQSAAHHVVKKLPAGGCTAVGCGIGRWGRRARLRTNLRITPRLAAASDSGGQFFFFALKSRRFVSLAARWTAPSASRRPWLTLRTTTTNLRSRFLRSHRFAYLRNKRNDIFTNEK